MAEIGEALLLRWNPMRTISDINPATEEVIAQIPCATAAEVTAAVSSARAAAVGWATRSFDERAAGLRAIQADLRQHAEELAHMISTEMGKPLGDSRAEVERFSDLGPLIDSMRSALAPQRLEAADVISWVYQDPLGVVAVITPWNYPMGMPTELIAPAILAGNGVVAKPSEITPLIGQMVVETFQRHTPPGLVRLVQGDEEVGKALVAADVQMIAFIGSQTAGRHIMAAAADGLKRLLLELGGKDPMVVLEGADLDAAADYATHHAYRNTGQVCCSVERILVARSIYAEFTRRCVELTRGYAVGDPCAPEGANDDKRLGPFAASFQREHVLAQLRQATQGGARVLCGGEVPAGKGYYLTPAVVVDVDPTSDLATKETFGPLAVITPFEDVNEAITRANDSPYALAGTVWGPQEQATAVARRLHSAVLGVNRGIGRAPGAPWGGAKQSGLGALDSPDGHRLFTQARTISVAPQDVGAVGKWARPPR